MVEGYAILIEEGSDLFPDMVDAVGWMAPEKPTLFEFFCGYDLLGAEVETICH